MNSIFQWDGLKKLINESNSYTDFKRKVMCQLIDAIRENGFEGQTTNVTMIAGFLKANRQTVAELMHRYGYKEADVPGKHVYLRPLWPTDKDSSK